MFRSSMFLVTAISCATPLLAAVPTNDRISRATTISALPFTHTIDTRAAVTDRRDPDCVGQGATVWYEFTPESSITVEANTFGSNYDTTLSVSTRSRGTALTLIACNDDADGLQSRVYFTAEAGVTYLIMAGSFASGPGGDLVINVDANTAPAAPQFVITTFDNAPINSTDGSLLIGGRLTCARPLWIELSGEVVQKYRGRGVRGFFGISLWCSGTTAWSAQVYAPFQRVRGVPVDSFRTGAATLNLTARAYDEQTGIGAMRGIRKTVRLEASR